MSQVMPYVERAVDADGLRTLRAGRDFYVFGPPGTGKTTLRRRMAETLRANGLRVAEVELGRLGAGALAGETGYFALAAAVSTAFGLPDPRLFWEQHAHLDPAERWYRYLRRVPPGAPVVLLIDEVEVLVDRPHEIDSVFAALLPSRAVGCTRVITGLFGTTHPFDLGVDIRHPGTDHSAVRRWFRTAIALEPGDFDPEEAQVLLPRLARVGGDPRALLAAVLRWTGGHPGTTGALVDAIAEGGPLMISGSERDTVTAQVEALFVEPRPEAVPALAAIARALDADDPPAVADAWIDVLRGEAPAWRPGDRAQERLRRAGIAVVHEARIVARSVLFMTVFDEDWAEARRIADGLPARLDAWEASGRADAALLCGEDLRRASRWAEGRPVDPALSALLVASWNRADRLSDRRTRERRMDSMPPASLPPPMVAPPEIEATAPAGEDVFTPLAEPAAAPTSAAPDRRLAWIAGAALVAAAALVLLAPWRAPLTEITPAQTPAVTLAAERTADGARGGTPSPARGPATVVLGEDAVAGPQRPAAVGSGAVRGQMPPVMLPMPSAMPRMPSAMPRMPSGMPLVPPSMPSAPSAMPSAESSRRSQTPSVPPHMPPARSVKAPATPAAATLQARLARSGSSAAWVAFTTSKRGRSA